MGEKRVQVGSKVLAGAIRRHALCSVVLNLFATPLTSPPGSSCPWNFPGKSTGVPLPLGCHFLLQSKE